MQFQIEGDFIELHQLLKATSLCSSGGQAKFVITDRLVEVDGLIETRKKCKIRAGQKVMFNDQTILVTRGNK